MTHADDVRQHHAAADRHRDARQRAGDRSVHAARPHAGEVERDAEAEAGERRPEIDEPPRRDGRDLRVARQGVRDDVREEEREDADRECDR